MGGWYIRKQDQDTQKEEESTVVRIGLAWLGRHAKGKRWTRGFGWCRAREWLFCGFISRRRERRISMIKAWPRLLLVQIHLQPYICPEMQRLLLLQSIYEVCPVCLFHQLCVFQEDPAVSAVVVIAIQYQRRRVSWGLLRGL